MAVTANRVICRNEVEIEGVSFGQFESFSLKSDMRSFGATAVLALPLYAIGITEKSDRGTSSGRASARVRNKVDLSNIKVCAEVNVYCWYEGYDKELVFHGFIEHVAEGFPTKLYLRDGSFILRFGEVKEGWGETATLQKIMDDCIPIAQEGFKKERDSLGFTRAIPELKYSTSGNEANNVQAVTTPLSFDNFAQGRAPFEVVQYLMQLLVLYAGVDNENNLYIGAGVKDSTRPIIKLDTRYNVIERDIVPVDGRFVDYDVKVTGVLKNGRKFTATGGVKTSRTADQKSQFDKQYGMQWRGFCLLDTSSGIQDMADRMLAMLKGTRNKGTISLLMYPKCQVLDHVDFTDSVFDVNDSKYYVIGYTFNASERGYYQKLEVTDRVFVL